MPFAPKYEAAIREAATARVLERLFTNPGDRFVFRVVSDEFSVGEQSLRAWVKAATSTPGARVPKKRRPRFSPVVIRKMEVAAEPPAPVAAEPPAPVAAEATPVVSEPAPVALTAAAVTPAVVVSHVGEHAAPTVAVAQRAELEAEISKLRRDNEALKAAMRVLLND